MFKIPAWEDDNPKTESTFMQRVKKKEKVIIKNKTKASKGNHAIESSNNVSVNGLNNKSRKRKIETDTIKIKKDTITNTKIVCVCEKWFAMNNLKLNVNKTKCMLFRSTVRNNASVNVISLGKQIDMVQNLKFLGVQIDSLLNWKSELTSITSTISSACYAIRSLRDVLSIAQLRTVYFALVESRLRYSVQFWGNSYKYNMEAAFVLQKRALRTILRIDQTESCKEHFVKLKILTVPCLYILVLLTHLHKNLSRLETNVEKEKRLETRRKDLPTILQAKLNVVKHSSLVQSVILFNKLPVELKSIQSVNILKNRLKTLLTGKAYYSIDEFCKDKNN